MRETRNPIICSYKCYVWTLLCSTEYKRSLHMNQIRSRNYSTLRDVYMRSIQSSPNTHYKRVVNKLRIYQQQSVFVHLIVFLQMTFTSDYKLSHYTSLIIEGEQRRIVYILLTFQFVYFVTFNAQRNVVGAPSFTYGSTINR